MTWLSRLSSTQFSGLAFWVGSQQLLSVPLARLAFWIWQPSDSSFISSSLAGTRAWHSQRIHFINQTGWTLGLGTAFNFITSFNQLAVWRRLSKLPSLQQIHQFIQRAGLLGIGSATLSSIQLGLPLGSGSQCILHFISSSAPAVSKYPRPFTSCAADKCLDRRLNSLFHLCSRPLRPFLNHNSRRG